VLVYSFLFYKIKKDNYKMKSVLLITYFFPPNPSIGSQRPFGLAKHLPQYGWKPIVLTIKHTGERPNGIEIIETDYHDIKEGIKSKIGRGFQKPIKDQSGPEISRNHYYTFWKKN
jgi:hypothetical protein